MCIFSVTWFSEYNTLTVTKHFEKVVYIYNKSAFEQRENCILKAKKGSINFFFKNYISTKMCSAKWEMTSLKSTDVLERISCSIANMTLEQIPLCIFFLFQTGNYFFLSNFYFPFSLGYGTIMLIFVIDVVWFCCIVNIYNVQIKNVLHTLICCMFVVNSNDWIHTIIL